ncbi:MAG: GNAT family N-acetyltransferase [Gammaproteobacteria bacterium]
MILRGAARADQPRLDEIALTGKASWGYAPEQLARWRHDLEVTPDSLVDWPTVVVETSGRIVGFAQLDPTQAPWDLARLFVDPGFHRRGIGRRLLARMRVLAAQAGQSHIAIDADPHAVLFYLACGALTIGQVAAPVPGAPNRTRPQLLLATGAP